MAKFKGRNFKIKAGDGADPEVFTIVANMRSTGASINEDLVDVTDKDGEGFRELLEGAGVMSMSLTGSGVMSDAATVALMMQRKMDRTIDNYQVVGFGGVIEGAFLIQSFELAGEHNGEQTYTIKLESSGEFTYTADA
jgi:TP901-1 family phage major tail protein